MVPTKKISLTLIEYAQRLIDDLPNGYSKEDLEAVLRLAAVIWNACVLDQWHNSTENTTAVRDHFAQKNPIAAAMVDALIKRKTRMFGNDPRAITNESVVVRDGEFIVRAEARLDLQNLDPRESIS